MADWVKVLSKWKVDKHEIHLPLFMFYLLGIERETKFKERAAVLNMFVQKK